jgi:hypothetical protein
VIVLRFAPVPPPPPELLTVSAAEPESPPDCAAIVAVPAATPVATPEGLMTTTLKFEELHCAEEVRSCVLPSEYVPVAFSEAVAETETDAGLGETETFVKDGFADPPELILFGRPLHAASNMEAKLKIPIALVRRTDVPPRELNRGLNSPDVVLGPD